MDNDHVTSICYQIILVVKWLGHNSSNNIVVELSLHWHLVMMPTITDQSLLGYKLHKEHVIVFIYNGV